MDQQTSNQSQKKCCSIKWGFLIVIFIILVGAAAYYLNFTNSEGLSEQEKQEIINSIQNQPDQDTKDLQQASNSDEIEAIANDLQNTELDSLDKELIDIEKELNI